MREKLRFVLGRFIGILIFLFLLQNSLFLQVKPEDLAKKYPEAEGLYEMSVPGQGSVVVQVYFKDGTLRTVEPGDAESTIWRPVEGKELTFETVSQKRGTFHLEFSKDGQGRYTKIRVVNETVKMDVTAAKKGELEDAKADPASPSDRQGYFERHYRKSEHQIPMRDGVRLFTQVYGPIDQSELHPILLFRTPDGIPPYGEAFGNQLLPLYFGKENYILVYQDIRGMGMSEGEFEYFRPHIKDKKMAADITISGPIKAELYVSTTGTDADWVVKVIDVYPDNSPDPKTNPANIRMGGYQRLVRGEVIRGKFRNSFEKPEPFVSSRVTKVEFELPDVQHTFLKGHRIMFQIQSSWFPLIDRNPQKFCNIRTADETDFQKATHRLYRSRQYPSGIIFRVLAK